MHEQLNAGLAFAVPAIRLCPCLACSTRLLGKESVASTFWLTCATSPSPSKCSSVATVPGCLGPSPHLCRAASTRGGSPAPQKPKHATRSEWLRKSCGETGGGRKAPGDHGFERESRTETALGSRKQETALSGESRVSDIQMAAWEQQPGGGSRGKAAPSPGWASDAAGTQGVKGEGEPGPLGAFIVGYSSVWIRSTSTRMNVYGFNSSQAEARHRPPRRASVWAHPQGLFHPACFQVQPCFSQGVLSHRGNGLFHLS